MSKFGWCAGPEGAIGDHKSCPFEIGLSDTIVRCGCGCHDTNSED